MHDDLELLSQRNITEMLEEEDLNFLLVINLPLTIANLPEYLRWQCDMIFQLRGRRLFAWVDRVVAARLADSRCRYEGSAPRLSSTLPPRP